MISDHQHKSLASVSHWRELPYREIWVYDTEFYPGRGLNNGGRRGRPSHPSLSRCARDAIRPGRSPMAGRIRPRSRRSVSAQTFW